MDLASSPCDSCLFVDKAGPLLDPTASVLYLEFCPKGRRRFRIVCTKLMSKNYFSLEPLNACQST